MKSQIDGIVATIQEELEVLEGKMEAIHTEIDRLSEANNELIKELDESAEELYARSEDMSTTIKILKSMR